MDRADRLAYAARIVGVVLFAAGIGGAVLGAYAPLQEEFDLCGGQTLQVAPATGGEGAAGAGGPTQFAFEDLSATERNAFEAALDAPTSETDVQSPLEHGTALEQGSIVTYENESYHFAVSSANRCVSVDPLVLPLGVTGVVLGVAIYGLPSLRRLRG